MPLYALQWGSIHEFTNHIFGFHKFTNDGGIAGYECDLSIHEPQITNLLIFTNSRTNFSIFTNSRTDGGMRVSRSDFVKFRIINHENVGNHHFANKFFHFHESRTKSFSRIHEGIFSFSRIHERKKANSRLHEHRWGEISNGIALKNNNTQDFKDSK